MNALTWALIEALGCTLLLIALKPYGVTWRDYREDIISLPGLALAGGIFAALSLFFWFSNTVSGLGA